MPRRLPPLNGLRSFEAAARHLSFTLAAQELNVTPAAVSQQVKLLEEYFGVRLFNRLTRALSLTDSGKIILPALTEGLDRLGEVGDLLRRREDEQHLTVSVAPAFGMKWLLPRLNSFREFAPDYEIRIDATDIKIDLHKENVDLAIRYGSGEYEGLISECLIAEHVVPVCSPELQSGKYPINSIEDLQHHTLLHSSWRREFSAATDWQMWLKAAGYQGPAPDKGPQFNLDSLAVQAAIEGQGVALVDVAMISKDVERGNLVKLFSEHVSEETKFCYFLCYPEEHLQRPKVKIFRDWVLAELTNDAARG
ncbi:MAG: LysR family glycine cleavage system transcriptional activator [Parvicella sp.]|jgi:LysR family glycine cleavage system transcriptional activator